MKKNVIHIKNMVCQRCISAVVNELSFFGLKIEEVVLGRATYIESPSVTLEMIAEAMKKHGFELIKESEEKLVELIKTSIIQLVHCVPEANGITSQNISPSQYLSKKTGKSYSYLSRLFSRHTKYTIEKYTILQRIEKAKELIEYGDLSFSEISYTLGYKSPTHLANQFREITGMSMGKYKENPEIRKPLDRI